MGTEFFRGVITYGAQGPSNIRVTAVQTVFLKAPQEVMTGWETLHWAKQSCRQILETSLVSVENPLKGKDYFHLLLHQHHHLFLWRINEKMMAFLRELSLVELWNSLISAAATLEGPMRLDTCTDPVLVSADFRPLWWQCPAPQNTSKSSAFELHRVWAHLN